VTGTDLLAAVVARGGALAPAEGVTGTVAVVVTGTTGGDVKARVRLVDGRPVEAAAGTAPDADLTLTLPVALAAAVAEGSLEPSVAFMRGQLKTAGDNGLLLGVLALTAAPGFAEWLAAAQRAPDSP
jgi:putative sterol carrier protein